LTVHADSLTRRASNGDTKIQRQILDPNLRGDFFINENELLISFIASIDITTEGAGVNR
jgi:hypothetical protein